MIPLPRATRRIAAVLVLCLPAVALAQTPAAGRGSARSKWEIELHGGASIASGSTGGTTGTLPQGQAMTAGVGFPSLRVSSWLFGDGAALFNSAIALAGRAERIAPLDAILTGPAAEYRSGAAVGFRLIRTLSSRFDAEFSVDYAPGALAVSEASATKIEATRQSFTTAYTALFSTAPSLFANRTVSSAATVEKTAGGRMFVGGGVRMHVSAGRRRAYLVGGVAMTRDAGASPGATIDSSYSFTNTAQTPFSINESEDVAIHFRSSTSVVGMAGLGFDVASWARSGLRIDARVFLGMDKIETVLDAQGTPRDGAPAGANWTPTSPAIQWSNNQDLAGQSSLSGSVSGFTTLTGSHFQAPVVVTIGYFFRF